MLKYLLAKTWIFLLLLGCTPHSAPNAQISQQGPFDEAKKKEASSIAQASSNPDCAGYRQPIRKEREPKDDSCPGLESLLLHVSKARDPLATAKSLGLRLRGNSVQVVITVSGNNLDFLANYDVEVCKQSGDIVVAFVPLNRLCDLANDGNVLAIRSVNQAIPQP